MSEHEAITGWLNRGLMTLDEARAGFDLLPLPDIASGSWPLNLPPAPVAKTQPRCSYCRFLADGDRCGNCGAPQ